MDFLSLVLAAGLGLADFRLEDEFGGGDGVYQAFVDDMVAVGEPGLKVVLKKNDSLEEEEYAVTRGGGAVTVTGATLTGLAWGLQEAKGMKVGEVVKGGSPDYGFRCFMADVARKYHSPSSLRKLVRWCQAGRVRYLQLHLTDDQNWMFPSEVLKGIDRFNVSGEKAYSREELRGLVEFAARRGVTVIPEIDMPGHSSLLVKHDEATFGIQGSESKSCVNFGSEAVRDKLSVLLNEVAEVFPDAPAIHIGGDEAWYPNAEKDPEMAKAMERLGDEAKPEEVFVEFLAEMCDVVIDLGKKPLVWEGFRRTEYAEKMLRDKTTVVAWEQAYFNPAELLEDGYEVINAGWDPYYVVNHYPYDLFTLVPLEGMWKADVRSFGIVNRPGDRTDLLGGTLHGGLMCWWEGREWHVDRMLGDRILAFGQSMWGRAADYSAFLANFEKVEARIRKESYPFTVAVDGGFGDGGLLFEKRVQLTVEGGSGRIAVRRDGKVPTVEDLVDRRTVEITETQVVGLQMFDGDMPVGETLFLPMRKVTVEKSLTTGCRVETEALADSRFGVGNIVDGVSDDELGYWLAYPAPTVAMIDLGEGKEVSRLQVVTSLLGGGASRFSVEGSLDGREWTMLFDASENEEAPTSDGYRKNFAAAMVRFLKVTGMGGKTYPSTMTRILEVRAY